MRGVLVCLVAGCGRFGFGTTPSPDARPEVDDVAVDSPGSGLVVAYAMDDDPSSGSVGASVAGLEGSCTRCPTSAPGRIGNAYMFDGTTELRLPATPSAVLGTQPYSVALWFQPTSATQGSPGVILAKPFSLTTNANVFSLWINNTAAGELYFETSQTGANGDYDYVNTPAGTMTRGAWHHAVASWDGAMKKLYVDGTLVEAKAAAFVSSTELVTIAADVDSNTVTLHYIGLLDELRLYDRALSAAEVADLANP